MGDIFLVPLFGNTCVGTPLPGVSEHEIERAFDKADGLVRAMQRTPSLMDVAVDNPAPGPAPTPTQDFDTSYKPGPRM